MGSRSLVGGAGLWGIAVLSAMCGCSPSALGNSGAGGEAPGGLGGAAATGGTGSGVGGSANDAWGGTTPRVVDAGLPSGDPACKPSVAACACDSQAIECQGVLMTACLGQHCPPSLDDAMLVANWPLDSSAGPPVGRTHGTYSECPSGSRWFAISGNGANRGFGFDGSGRLAVSYTYGGGSCAQLVCGADPLATESCPICQILSDPRPAGSSQLPGSGISNGPVANCEIDANGRWSMPRLAPAN